MGCRAELLKPVEIPQVQFSDKVSIGSCAILAENIETSWVTFAWRLVLSMLRVSVRGLSCRTAEARGDSTGAVLGLVVTCATDREGLLGFADFLGHLCQSQVPVVPESPGVHSQVTRHRVFAN